MSQLFLFQQEMHHIKEIKTALYGAFNQTDDSREGSSFNLMTSLHSKAFSCIHICSSIETPSG